MKRAEALYILSLGLLLGLVACGVDDENPGPALPSQPRYGEVIDLPDAAGAADPAVIEVDGAWYLYPTHTGIDVECWRSTDLETWTYEGVVWGPAESGTWNDAKVWAPDVFEHEGQFYLYYTANMKIGVAVADDPTGPFVDVYDHPLLGGGQGGVAFNTIDAHMFRDADGAFYLYATGYLPIAYLRVFLMADPVTVGGDWEFLFAANPLSWELFINEGPWMIVHDGVYYLMYSGHGADRPRYSLGYATASCPMGPFTKYQGNPILKADEEYDFWGPGHNSVTVGPDGDFWIFYHTKDNRHVGWDRHVRKNRIAFTDDGRLYVDLGLGPPPPILVQE